jgi:hypothetical protein
MFQEPDAKPNFITPAKVPDAPAQGAVNFRKIDRSPLPEIPGKVVTGT